MQYILLPETPKVVKKEDNRAIIEIDGCWPGYGMTIGNALRRVILSSLPGAAITSVKIKNVTHEFSAIPGILENVVSLMLNLKQVRVKLHGEGVVRATISAKGERVVRARDIAVPSEAEICNPDQVIATLTAPESELEMELEIEHGMGYVPMEERRKEKLEIGLVALDAIFSPIRRVNFEVENMRVGDRTDFNRIRFDIETDGSTTPEEAFQKSVAILMEHVERLKDLRVAAETERPAAPPSLTAPESDTSSASATEATQNPLEDMKLGVRVTNVLKEAGFQTIGDIAGRSDAELLALDGLGEKALKDIKKALGKMGLTLPEKS